LSVGMGGGRIVSGRAASIVAIVLGIVCAFAVIFWIRNV
jgi:hypothetical protein